jgi:pantothenate kinase
VKDADLDQTVSYTRRTVQNVFHPLVEEISADARVNGERSEREPGERAHRNRPDRNRYLLALAGPPGCGKSTVAAVLRELLTEKGIRALILPLDGFHLRNEELKKRKIAAGDGCLSLFERKGAKESYDIGRLLKAVKGLRNGDPIVWPVYSRTLHEPVEEGVPVGEGDCICIIEGNYLLLDVQPWSRIREFFDKRIMILGRLALMRKRIVSRKIRGGFTRVEAEAHFRRSDAINIAEVIERSAGYDLLLAQRGRHGFAVRTAAQPKPPAGEPPICA